MKLISPFAFLKKFGFHSSGQNKIKKLGTFGGVFTPTTLTILGVIMYLRLGWVVGNAGLLGAIIIILLAKSITIFTGLSMASISTNIKIGAGGAYSIISKSLGLEAGGSVGIPFYVSQTLSAALYIIGFTEGWIQFFPDHSPVLVSTCAWGLLLIISSISADFAIRVQYIILIILGVSIVSFVFTDTARVGSITLIGNFEDGNFWYVFAIFFPAVTGIMAGANLSGDLKTPSRSITIGTLSSVGITLIIYAGLAVVFANYVEPEVLRENELVMADIAIWRVAVLLGLLAATFSSALGSMMGAPRILQALAAQKTVPFYKTFVIKSKNNEPRNAIIFTGIVIEIALLTGDLDALAALITMFFLITYGILNLVVFIQQSMRIISFRPTFKIPRVVPFLGAMGCVLVMFLINPVFSFIAIVVIIILYFWLERRGLESEWGDIRGGMLLLLAERASRLAEKFPRHQISWKPDFLIPVEDPKVWTGNLLFIRNIAYPSGSIFAFTVKENESEEIKKDLEELLQPLKEQNILVNSTIIQDTDFLHGARLVIQTLRGGSFRPNTLFLSLGTKQKNDVIIKSLVDYASKSEMGVVILKQHSRVAFGMQKDLNIWLRDKSPNWNLSMLIALQIQLNWEGKFNLITVVPEKKDEHRVQRFFEKLSDQARLPSQTEFHILFGKFNQAINDAPRADINIFGIAEEFSADIIRKSAELTKSSCLFVKDAGWESALA
jgi:amino acid transporter